MASLDMDGPFPLDANEVARVVSKAGPGNFALGKMDKQKRFVVRFVGRDDRNVREAILQAAQKVQPAPGLIGRLLGKDEGADAFKFSYAQDPDAAFSKHCRNYHGFNSKGQLENKTHPKPPNGGPAKCPVCGNGAG